MEKTNYKEWKDWEEELNKIDIEKFHDCLSYLEELPNFTQDRFKK